MSKVKAISPNEAVARQKDEIPSFVLEAFNALIVENLRDGVATFSLEEARERVRRQMREGEQLPSRWLDVEKLYRDEGWEVNYDQPGYNESYPATFTFRTPF